MADFFVTGASGFIGSHLVNTLLERGHSVCCLSRNPPSRFANFQNLEWIRADIGESAAYRDALARVDCVLHLAGVLAARRPSDYDETNVAGTGELLRAAKMAGAPRRFVYVSSIAAMGPRYDGGLLSESCRCAPESEYGASKLAAEELVFELAGPLAAVVLRPSFVYGKGDTRAATYLRTLLAPMPRPWTSNIKTISLCHVADVVEACLLAAKDDIPGGEVCIISESELYTWESLRGIVTRAFDELVASGAAQTHGDGAALLARLGQIDIPATDGPHQQHWGCDTSKARVVLGFQTTRSARTSATETLRSYIAAGLLTPFFEIGNEIDRDIHVSRTEPCIITEPVREFILSSFMPGDPAENLRNDDLLLEGGIVDSAGVMSLVLFLEKRFGIRVLDDELFAENFGSVDRISAFVEGKLNT